MVYLIILILKLNDMSFNTNFNWRPNDASSETLHKYSLEAERWINAVNDVTTRESQRSHPMLPFIILSHLLTLVLCIIIFLVLGIKYLFFGLADTLSSNNKVVEDVKATQVVHINAISEALDPNDPDLVEKLHYQQIANELEEKRINKNK